MCMIPDFDTPCTYIQYTYTHAYMYSTYMHAHNTTEHNRTPVFNTLHYIQTIMYMVSTNRQKVDQR